MAFFEGWPYTNFHDCNLDWVMETTRKVHVEVHQLHQELHRAINCEEQQRIDADVKLGERIDKEITDRTEADNALSARIDKEIQDRVDAVQAEEEARIAADNALGARIDKEITDRQQADNALQDAINAEESARQDAINAEATARQAADAKLQKGIDAEAAARAQAVTAEAEARAAADTALGQRIDAEAADRTQAINAEVTARQQADTALGARIDKEITDRTAKDSELETAIANEATARAKAVTDLRDDLTHEISDRKAGDDALGRRIDGITPQLVPAGGTQRQVLGKTTGDDYAIGWLDPAAAVNGLPEGGTVGQILAKKGPDNFDAEWIDAPEGGSGTGEDPNAIHKDGTTVTTAAIPFAKGIQTPSITGTGMEGVALEANLDLNNHAITSLLPGTDEFDAVTVGQLNDKFANVHSIPVGGTARQVLGKIDGTDYNVTWVDQTGGEGGNVPAGGTTGQVLAKSTDADYQTEWVNQTGGLPEGGTVGQVLTKAAEGSEWGDIPESNWTQVTSFTSRYYKLYKNGNMRVLVPIEKYSGPFTVNYRNSAIENLGYSSFIEIATIGKFPKEDEPSNYYTHYPLAHIISDQSGNFGIMFPYIDFYNAEINIKASALVISRIAATGSFNFSLESIYLPYIIYKAR